MADAILAGLCAEMIFETTFIKKVCKKREKGTMVSIKTSYPTKCVLWKTENLLIEQLHQIFEVITTYEDESHLIRKLLRCKECGHLYFKEFYEEIDWSEGKDAQYTTWIPVDDAESGEELSKMSPIGLLSYPSIRYDYPMRADQPRGPHWNCSRNL